MPARLLSFAADSSGEADSLALRHHFGQLIENRQPITPEELADTGNLRTAFDAVAALRPYWLSDVLGAAVSVGHQLVGGRESLEAIRIDAVDSIQLAFDPHEPHWTITVQLR